MATTDRYGNPVGGELPYATGEILADVADQYREIQAARAVIRERYEADGPESVFNFSGLERGFPVEPGELEGLDDETAPAVHGPAFERLGLEHLGGDPDRHDVFLANRMTAATTSTFLELVEPGETVVGVAPNTSHASVVRAAEHVGAAFVGVTDLAGLEDALDAGDVSLVALSRMDVTYNHFDVGTARAVVEAAHDAGARVYMDDAGGARVLPALFDHPLSLRLGVDVVSTGLDKYGVDGPRFGLLGGEADLVSRIRTRAWSFGLEARPVAVVAARRSLEAYDPERVRASAEVTREVGAALADRLGDDLVRETPVITVLAGEDVLAEAMSRAGLDEPPVVPFEATAALSMALLREHGAVTVHFAGVPSGTGDFLVKFLPPAEVDRFGGPGAVAAAVDHALDVVAARLDDPGALAELILG